MHKDKVLGLLKTVTYPGFSRDIVERCLAHSPEKKGAMGHYDNTQFLDKRKEFLTWWSSELVSKGLKI